MSWPRPTRGSLEGRTASSTRPGCGPRSPRRPLARVSRVRREVEDAKPAISVVVPAHNAQGTVPRLLAALGRSTFSRPWELVLVDDASTDATADLAESWGARVVRLASRGGAAAARNAGLAAAAAPLIAFTDADCEPCPDWLSELEVGLIRADLVTGRVLPAPGQVLHPFARTLRITQESALFETANLAVRREMVDRVGGFEPFAPVAGGPRVGLRPSVEDRPFGEDVVFGWKARRLGARTGFVEGALVHHAVFPQGARGYIAERWRLRFFPALVLHVPEIRSELPQRVFLSRTTALFDLALAGIVAAGLSRSRWLLSAALPYLARRFEWHRVWRRCVARRNLALLVGDGVGFVALVKGSIASRRLLI
jgi:glycosyltransferase involved in cell wall biosynthesis